MFDWRRFVALVFLACLMLVSVSHPLDAQTVTEGFSSDGQPQTGMIQVVVSGLIIFITGLFGVYLILRL